MYNAPTLPPPTTPRFSISAFFWRVVGYYILLLPPAIWLLYHYNPRMPDPVKMYQSAGPFAIVFLLRSTLQFASFGALPAALVLAVLPLRLRCLLLVFVYLALALVLLWTLH